ncbi:MAG: outer membrane lipid asymmetry maintenance protein MlaD [Acidobacteriota bacterium]
MADSKVEILAGAAVLAVALGFAIYASRSAGFGTGEGQYPLHASFRSVEGVTIGTDVRMAGVKIGSVTALSLNPKTYMADATVTVKDGIEIPDDSTILVSSEGLLGGSFVEIQPGGSPTALAAGGEIEDTQGAVSMVQLLMKFVGGAADSAAASGGDGTSEAP